jgi:putative oxidoreductase
MGANMKSSRTLFAAGTTMLLGALLHIAIIFGGPDWYAFVGAPAGLVKMASAGSLRPAISCVAISVCLARSALLESHVCLTRFALL